MGATDIRPDSKFIPSKIANREICVNRYRCSYSGIRSIPKVRAFASSGLVLDFWEYELSPSLWLCHRRSIGFCGAWLS